MDYLVIVKKLGSDLLEAKNALEALWDDIGTQGRRETSVEVERKVRAALWDD